MWPHLIELGLLHRYIVSGLEIWTDLVGFCPIKVIGGSCLDDCPGSETPTFMYYLACLVVQPMLCSLGMPS